PSPGSWLCWGNLLMKDAGRFFLDASGLCAVLVILCVDSAPAQEPPPSPAPEVIRAWQKAGARFGWMQADGSGEFRAARAPRRGELPVVGFAEDPKGRLGELDGPGVPFGLRFDRLRDADLKEVAALPSLHVLSLDSTRVSDAGLKELAALKALETLD